MRFSSDGWSNHQMLGVQILNFLIVSVMEMDGFQWYAGFVYGAPKF